MIKTAISLLMSFIMLIFNTIGAALPGFVPKSKSESELTGLTDIFDVHPLAQEIAVVQSSKTSDEELAAIICLQGLVNRDEASIFINYGYDSQTELNDLEGAGCKLLYADSDGNAWRLESLIRRYSSHINDNGYVLFTSKNDCNQINMAFNFASVYGWLAIPQSMEYIAKASGLEKLEDLTEQSIDIAYQRNFYNKNKKTFKKIFLFTLTAVRGVFVTLPFRRKFLLCSSTRMTVTAEPSEMKYSASLMRRQQFSVGEAMRKHIRNQFRRSGTMLSRPTIAITQASLPATDSQLTNSACSPRGEAQPNKALCFDRLQRRRQCAMDI